MRRMTKVNATVRKADILHASRSGSAAMPAQQLREGRRCPPSGWLVRAVCAAAASAALAAAAPAQARSRAFDEAVQQYRAGHLADAFGRFFALANEGDADAARIALFMHQYGPVLYGRYWDAAPQDVARWQALQHRPGAHPQPAFRPDWVDDGSFRQKPKGRPPVKQTAVR
jgi:hypothetical protein